MYNCKSLLQQGLCILFSLRGEITKQHQPFAVLSLYGHILHDHPIPTSTTTLCHHHRHSTTLAMGLLLASTTITSTHYHITTRMMPMENGRPRTANEGQCPCHHMWHGHWEMVSFPTTPSPSRLLTHITAATARTTPMRICAPRSANEGAGKL